MKVKRFIISLSFLMAVVFVVTAWAQSTKRQYLYEFDDKINYDVYFDTGKDTVSVIRRAEIVGFEDIAGRLFLVIRSDGFNLTEQEGYIRFDSITAILPERSFKVEENRQTNIKY